MTKELVVALVIVLAVVVYTLAKVWRLARKSEEQWQAADKSKLKAWEDDDAD